MSSDQELPEQGEIVVATISRIMDHGAYVALDEYGGMQGFLHISEIAPGWIRSVAKFVREGEKKVLLVKKVNPGRSDVDLSLKQVSADQRKRKLLEVKREEKGRTLMKGVAEKAGLSDAEREGVEDLLYSRYDSLFDAFMDIASRGSAAAGSLKIPGKALAVIEEVCSKIKLPSVEVRGVVEVTSPSPDGVEVVRKALLDASGGGGGEDGVRIEITYLGAPKYRVGVTAPDFKAAEKALKPIVAGIQRGIEKKRGTFRFEREESKKTRVE